MDGCKLASACVFFNDQMKDMPGASNAYKRKYCETTNSTCARFMVFKTLGKEAVPADLYPNQLIRARYIIGKG